jgi:cell wall-associated NlpC family hydrolase
MDCEAQRFPTLIDTLDIGTVYRNDTVNINAKIKNIASRPAKITKVSWQRNSDFSSIKYDRNAVAPGEFKYFKFKVRNIVKRNADIDRILMVSTEYQTFKIYIFAKFDSRNNPEKKMILPQLASSSSSSSSSSITKNKHKRPEKKFNKTDSIAVIAVAKALPKVEQKPDKIVRSPNQTTDSLIRFSTEFMGTPYIYGGYTPEGFDCSGFVQYVFNGVKQNLPRTSRAQALEGLEIHKNDAKPGDLIFFEGSQRNGIVGHVGIIIYVDDKGIVFIHSSTKKGVTLSELEFDYYSSRLLAIKRIIH